MDYGKFNWPTWQWMIRFADSSANQAKELYAFLHISHYSVVDIAHSSSTNGYTEANNHTSN